MSSIGLEANANYLSFVQLHNLKLQHLLQNKGKCEGLQANAPNFVSAAIDGSHEQLGDAKRPSAFVWDEG